MTEVSGTCSALGEKRNAHKMLTGKHERNGLLSRLRFHWGNDIEMDNKNE